MPPEGFLQRWSRLKTDNADPVPAPDGEAGHPVAADAAAADAAAVDVAPTPGEGARHARQLTVDDVARLDAGADYSPFVARGVDQSVRRSALKKMFSDPHFNIGDGLDLYMGDYNKPDPMPAAMLAALQHSKSFFAQAYPSEENADAPYAVEPAEPHAVRTTDTIAAGPATQLTESGHAMAGNPAATRGDNEGTAS